MPGPKSGKFERCVAAVAIRDGRVGSPEAVCAAALRKTGWKPRRAGRATLRAVMRARGNAEYIGDAPKRGSVTGSAVKRFWGSKAEALAEADRMMEHSGKVYAVADGPTKSEYVIWQMRGNPHRDAAALSEAFHGRSSQHATEIVESLKVHKYLTDLGGLEEIVVVDRDGRHGHAIRFGHDTRLASNEAGTQLFVVGGDQSLDLDALRIPAREQDKELVEIGPVRSLTYSTSKHHLDDADHEEGPYIHTLGEESGVLPLLAYDTRNEQVLFVGGSYSIPVEKDGYSPGIED